VEKPVSAVLPESSETAEQKAGKDTPALRLQSAAAPAIGFPVHAFASQLLLEVLAVSESRTNSRSSSYQQASKESPMTASSRKKDSFLSIVAEWASVSTVVLVISCFLTMKIFHTDLSTLTIVGPLFSVIIGALVTICLRAVLAR
jgi:hypothetical protein